MTTKMRMRRKRKGMMERISSCWYRIIMNISSLFCIKCIAITVHKIKSLWATLDLTFEKLKWVEEKRRKKQNKKKDMMERVSVEKESVHMKPRCIQWIRIREERWSEVKQWSDLIFTLSDWWCCSRLLSFKSIVSFYLVSSLYTGQEGKLSRY